MATYPTRGQSAPNYWDQQLKDYIDSSDSMKAKTAGGASATALKRGPALVAGVDYTSAAITASPTGTTGASYALSGTTRPADWPVDEGEGISIVQNNYLIKYGSSQPTWGSYRFMSDSPHVVLGVFALNATDGARVYIDGRSLDVNPLLTPGATVEYLEIKFAAAKARLFEIRTDLWLNAVYVDTPYKVWKPPARRGPRVLFIADSYGATPGSPPINTMNSCYADIGPQIGSEDVWVDAVSSTGFGVTSAANGSDAPNNRFSDRLQPISAQPAGITVPFSYDILGINPDVVVVHGGGLNDLFKGKTVNQVIASVVSVFTTLRAKLPSARLVFIEGFAPPLTTPATYNPNYVAIRQGVQVALVSVGVYYVDVATTSPWIYGTGYAGHTTGNGNADIYINADATHPNDLCHKDFLRHMIGSRIRTILNDDGSLLNQLV